MAVCRKAECIESNGGGLIVSSDEIDDLRRDVDNIDKALISLVADRVDVTRRIGLAKRTLGRPISEPSRESEIFAKTAELARERGLSPDVSEAVMQVLVSVCKDQQVNKN